MFTLIRQRNRRERLVKCRVEAPNRKRREKKGHLICSKKHSSQTYPSDPQPAHVARSVAAVAVADVESAAAVAAAAFVAFDSAVPAAEFQSD